MSAIAGLIEWQGGPTSAAVKRALDALALHGRDGMGLWHSDGAALGWRGTILHEEDQADRQPLAGADGSLHLVFDGRIDNRSELGEALALARGHAAWPDSAFALAAFEKWGADCAERLLGDFAFAVWDERSRQLVLARDHIGYKPLFLHRGAGFVMFASQPSALFTNGRVPMDLHDENLLLHLMGVQLDRNATVYRGIERVPCGHVLRIGERSVNVTRHWRPEALPPLEYRRDEEYVEHFRTILDDAVACRLRSVHPVGSHLSSGWDSSTVTAVAARLLSDSRRTLTAYTAVPPADWVPRAADKNLLADESPIAADVVRQSANVEHLLVRGSGRLDLSVLDRHADAFEIPNRTINNLGWLETLGHNARDRGIRVMLSAGAGNRTISPDGLQLLARLLREGEWTALWREGRGLLRRGASLSTVAAASVGPYLPESLWNGLQRARGKEDPVTDMVLGVNPSALSERRLREIVASDRFNPVTSARMDDRGMRRFCTETPDMGSLWAGSLAAWDIETRDPAADRRLMEFRATVPDRQYLSNGQTKWLVRRAMEGRLPNSVTTLRTRGRQAAEWFDAAGRSEDDLRVEIDLVAADARLAALFDIPLLKSLVTVWPDRLKDADQTRAYRVLLITTGVARFARRLLEKSRGRPG